VDMVERTMSTAKVVGVVVVVGEKAVQTWVMGERRN